MGTAYSSDTANQIDDSDDDEFIAEAVETEPIESESAMIATKNTSRAHESNG